MAAFEDAMQAVLKPCIALAEQRGSEYADTWALENLKTSCLEMVLREIAKQHSGQYPADTPPHIETNQLSREEKRLILIASLCDTKISRTLGPYKNDTLDDGINYLAALRHWMNAYVGRREAS